jgi:hypothetical protein
MTASTVLGLGVLGDVLNTPSKFFPHLDTFRPILRWVSGEPIPVKANGGHQWRLNEPLALQVGPMIRQTLNG